MENEIRLLLSSWTWPAIIVHKNIKSVPATKGKLGKKSLWCKFMKYTCVFSYSERLYSHRKFCLIYNILPLSCRTYSKYLIFFYVVWLQIIKRKIYIISSNITDIPVSFGCSWLTRASSHWICDSIPLQAI